MKTPQEYVELFAESLDWEELITMIQKEAWNEAVYKDAYDIYLLTADEKLYNGILKNKI